MVITLRFIKCESGFIRILIFAYDITGTSMLERAYTLDFLTFIQADSEKHYTHVMYYVNFYDFFNHTDCFIGLVVNMFDCRS